jgi:hypothetical protein
MTTTMTASVEVGVATARPPREHAVIGVLVSVEVHDMDLDRADAEAREIASVMAASHPHVVMPVRATILDVTL